MVRPGIKHPALRAVRWLAIAAAVLATLPGCASISDLKPDFSTAAQARQALGIPTDIWIARNGDEIWEYAQGPSGRQTFMLRFGSGGVISEIKQVLTDETVALIKPGQSTKSNVRALLGRPSEVSIFAPGEEIWEYPMQSYLDGTYTTAVWFGRDGSVAKVGKLLDFFGGKEGGSRGR